MQSVDIFDQLLDIHPPWKVLNVLANSSTKRVDIFIGFGEPEKKGFLGLARATDFLGGSKRLSCPYCHTTLPRNGEYETISLQHLPFAGFATYLHVPAPDTVQSSFQDCRCMRIWNAKGSSCTVAMRGYLVSLLQTGVRLKTVAQLAAVPEEQLVELRSSADVMKAPVTSPGVSREKGVLPGPTSEKWQHVARGDLVIQTQLVALNLLLQRVRRKMDESSGAESDACVKQLHHFFTRNKKLLKNEIEQLNS